MESKAAGAPDRGEVLGDQADSVGDLAGEPGWPGDSDTETTGSGHRFRS